MYPHFHVKVEVEGDPTDGHDTHATCTDRWHAATADTSKGMYNTFAETGVFFSVCRHGIIWTILDMMRSLNPPILHPFTCLMSHVIWLLWHTQQIVIHSTQHLPRMKEAMGAQVTL